MTGDKHRANANAVFPAGRVGYAVGDIHGCATLLTQMLELIESDVGERSAEAPPILIFLGDYIDRGPDSRSVLEQLVQPRMRAFEARFLLGNHEAAMLAFFGQPEKNGAWLAHGGMETIASYDVAPPPLNANAATLRRTAELLQAAMPPAHDAFLRALETQVFYGDYLFAHAGVDPKRSPWQQNEADLLWIRDRFLNARSAFSYMVVHGHTPAPAFYADHRRIGIDTGAYMSGILTGVKLWADQIAPLSVVAAQHQDAEAAAAPVQF